MSYQDGIDSLTRSSTVVVALGLDNTLSGLSHDYISMGDVDPSKNYYACVEKVDWIPTRIKEDGGLGQLSDLVITAKDFNYSGGTYFGNLISSNTYYLNRVIDVYVGFYELGETLDLANFQKRTYFLKKIQGPDQDGKITFTASDALSRLKESEAPDAVSGSAASALSETDTGLLTIGSTTGFDSSGYAIINDEIVYYSSLTSTQINISTRAQGGSEADEHDIGDEVRFVKRYQGNVVDIIRQIIDEETDIDTSLYIDDTEWDDERDSNLSLETIDFWIVESESCDKLINTLCKNSLINVWWDDANQKIRIKAIGPAVDALVTWNDEGNLITTDGGKVKVTRDQRKIITRVWYYFEKRDKSGGNDAKNFNATTININAQVESELGEERVRKVYAESVPASSSISASRIASRLITQSKVPLELVCIVDAKDSGIDIGDSVIIDSRFIPEGQTVMRVIEKHEKPKNRYQYKLVKTGQEVSDRFFDWGPDTLTDYASASQAEKDQYGFWADDDPDVDGDPPYLWA